MQNCRIAWLSDLHFDLTEECRIEEFFMRVRESKPRMILITGDISTSGRIQRDLLRFADLGIAVCFVLGNHDYYGSSFGVTESKVSRLCKRHPKLTRLHEGTIMFLKPGYILVGHDGWGDGRAGTGNRTRVRMNDSRLIADLAGLSDADLFLKLNALGDASARSMNFTLGLAVRMADHILIATHVPPWPKASQHNGNPGDPEFWPHFTNVALGELILKIAKANPRKSFSVVCGHTHSQCFLDPAENVTVKVAGATYGAPAIADILTF